MTVRSEFLFIAGEPALDFLNTEIVSDGERVDLLETPEDLGRWMAEAKLAAHAVVTPSVLAGAKRMRAALRDIMEAVIARKPVRREAQRTLNIDLNRGRGALALSTYGGGFSVEFVPERPDARFLLAQAAATFLARANTSRIRRCEGADCILFFYDTTRSGTRRWCTMAGCGNRMKAALHYQRTKKLR